MPIVHHIFETGSTTRCFQAKGKTRVFPFALVDQLKANPATAYWPDLSLFGSPRRRDVSIGVAAQWARFQDRSNFQSKENQSASCVLSQISIGTKCYIGVVDPWPPRKGCGERFDDWDTVKLTEHVWVRDCP